MAVYAVFEVILRDDPTPEDLEAYQAYRAAVPALIERFGGTYLARAWQGEALEGAPAGDRYHLIEFPDAETAKAFWTSPEYQVLQPGRRGAADVRALLLSQP